METAVLDEWSPRSRAITLRLRAFYFFLFFGYGGLLPLLPLYLKGIHLSGTQIGTLLAVGPIISILVQPVWGIVCDRYQAQRTVLIVALSVAAISGLLLQIPRTYMLLIVVYGIMILFQSAIVPIADAVTLSHMQKEKGDYGSVRLWGALGFAVAVWTAGMLTQVWGIQAIFYVYVFSFGCCLLFVRRLPQEAMPLSGSIWTGLGKLVKLPSYVLFLIGSFLIFGPINSNNSYFSLFYTQIGGTMAGVGTAFLLFAGSEAPVMRIAGRVMQRFGMVWILTLTGMLSAARWFFYSTAPSSAWVIGLFFIQGLSVGLFLPVAAGFIRKVAPRETQVTAQAIYAAVGNGLGTMVTSFVAGVLLDTFGIFTTYRYFGASSLLGAFVFLILGIRWRKRAI